MTIKSNEKTGTNEVKLVIALDKAEFEAAIEKAYKKTGRKYRINGWNGKKAAPRAFIERYYGKGVFYEEAINASFPDAYSNAVKEAGITPVDQPKVELVDVNEDGYSFSAVITTKPVAVVKNYKGLEGTYEMIPVTDEDVDKELERRRKTQATTETVERPAANGDTVVIDFEGFVDGVAFEGGKGENHNLKLGSGSFIPGFEDQLIGTSAGEEKTVTVTFPEDYGAAELAGKEAEFKCVVHEVKEEILPELDDEFAKDVSEFETLADFKADLKTKLTKARENAADNDYRNNIIDALLEETEVEVPQCMVESETDRTIEDFNYRFSAQGMSVEAYLKASGQSVEEFRAGFADRSLRSVKVSLALEAVAAAENFEVTDEELEAEYNKLAENNGLKVEEVKKYLAEENVRHDILSRKAYDFVAENGVKTEPKDVAEEPASASPAEEKSEN